MTVPNVLIVALTPEICQINNTEMLLDLFNNQDRQSGVAQLPPNIKQNKAYYITRIGETRLHHMVRCVSKDDWQVLDITIGNSFVYKADITKSKDYRDFFSSGRFYMYKSLGAFGLHQIAPGLCVPLPNYEEQLIAVGEK